MKFRKKPVVIEAVQLTRPFSNATRFCPSLRLIRGDNNRVEFGIVPTLEGDHRADIGDWIIRGVKGESAKSAWSAAQSAAESAARLEHLKKAAERLRARLAQLQQEAN